MYKIVIFAAIIAVALAAPKPEPKPEPKPGLVAAAYSAPLVAAPYAYAAAYSAPIAYSAPLVYPGYTAGYTAYSPYTGSLVVV